MLPGTVFTYHMIHPPTCVHVGVPARAPGPCAPRTARQNARVDFHRLRGAGQSQINAISGLMFMVEPAHFICLCWITHVAFPMRECDKDVTKWTCVALHVASTIFVGMWIVTGLAVIILIITVTFFDRNRHTGTRWWEETLGNQVRLPSQRESVRKRAREKCICRSPGLQSAVRGPLDLPEFASHSEFQPLKALAPLLGRFPGFEALCDWCRAIPRHCGVGQARNGACHAAQPGPARLCQRAQLRPRAQ